MGTSRVRLWQGARLVRSLPSRLLAALVVAACLLQALPTQAASPVVKAVLFWSSSCPHCHTVIEEVLPPIQKKYGAQFQLKMLQMEQPASVTIYYEAVDLFKISKERTGVPTLIVGDQVLVGSQEIPDRLDAEIQKDLAKGGVDYPPLPNLAQAPSVDMCGPNPCGPNSGAATASLRPDPIGTGIAIVVLLAMLVVLAYAARAAVIAVPSMLSTEQTVKSGPPWKGVATIVLAVAGLGISAYLTYVEVTRSSVLCGPIGNCDAVQTSAYATLLGVPVAILGALGYAGIIFLWIVRRLATGRLSQLASLALLALVVVAVLFSVYLTLIELLVLHAICTWCVSSAVVVTLLLAITASEIKRPASA
jgi:uncharacterized membrane protein